jgi:hypothetical protein
MSKWKSGGKTRKGFSPAQRPELNAYLALAWVAHCRRERLDQVIGARCLRKRCEEAGCVYCTWYEDMLEAATGHRSSKECNAGRDFEWFMADLEEVHGQDIKWQMKKFGGDARRILHAIEQVSAGAAISEEYLRKIATNALREHDTPVEWVMPELHLLAPRELVLVKNAVLAHVRAKVARGELLDMPVRTVAAAVNEEDPF